MMRCKNVKNNFKMNFIKLIYTFSPKSGVFGYADENWKFWEKYKFEKEWNIEGALFYFDISHKQYTTSECQHTCTNKAW